MRFLNKQGVFFDVKWSKITKSVRFHWILSYLIAFLIPLLTSIIVFINIDIQLENRRGMSSLMLLDTVSQQLGSHEEDYQMVAFRMMVDEDFKQLATEALTGGAADRRRLQKYIASYSFGRNHAEEIIFLEKEHGLMVSNQTVSTTSLFYESLKSEGGPTDYDEFCELFFTGYSNNYAKIRVGEHYKVYYIAAYPFDTTASIAIEMNFDTVKNMQSMIGADEDVAVIDRNGAVMFSINGLLNQISSQSLMTNVDGENQAIPYEINGKDYLLYYTDMKLDGFKTVYIAEKNGAMSSLSHFRFSSVLSVCLCVVLWIYFVFIGVKRSYAPLQNIMQVVKDKNGSRDESETEYIVIRDAIAKAYKDIEQMRTALGQNQKIVYSNLLSTLLGKNIGSDYPVNRELLASNEILFTTDRFCVVVFWVRRVEDVFSEDKLSSKQRMEYAHFIIENIMTEMMQHVGKAYSVRADNSLVMILNINEHCTEPDSAMKAVCIEGMDIIRDNFGFVFHAAMGDEVLGIGQIHASYEHARQAYSYSMTESDDNVSLYRDVTENMQGHSRYAYISMSDEEKLTNSILAGNGDIANEVVRGVFKQVAVGGGNERAVSSVVGRFKQIFSEALEDSKLIHEKDKMKWFLEIDNIQTNQTAEALCAAFLKLAQGICDGSRDKKPELDSVMNNIVEYIQANYSDKNLSVANIADHFCFSPNYISHAFKMWNGEGLLSYINRVRIGVAKEIIKQRNGMRLEDIADMVGYNSRASFTRVFTKYVGMSPQEWRDYMRKQ